MDEQPITLDTFGATDVGKKRPQNEDQFLIATMTRAMVVERGSLPTPEGQTYLGKPDGTLLVVADGMGGAAAGEVASSIAVATIAERLCNFSPFVVKKRKTEYATVRNLRHDLAAAIAAGETNIREAAGTGKRRGMGTTLTVAYLLWPRLYVAHVGDSRCYLHRAGKLEQLTQDHTIAQQLADRGMEVDDASRLHNVLWNALGGRSGRQGEPDVVRADLTPGDTVLLCSDGLTKHVSNADIADVLDHHSSAQRCCTELIAMANRAGGTDNITVVISRGTAREAQGT